jgi:hypothetical protein
MTNPYFIDDAAATRLLLEHLQDRITARDSAGALEALRHLETVAGQEFTDQLITGLIRAGLARLTPTSGEGIR